MSEMIERVAIAICENEIGGKLPGTLDDTGYESSKYWRELGRIAIAAMREPTEAMKIKGSNTVVLHSWGSGGEYIYVESAGDVFTNMIDEALK